MIDPIANTLNPKVQTIPRILAQHGYTTQFISNDEPNIGIELGYDREFQTIRLTPGSFVDKTMQSWFSAIDAVKHDNQLGKSAFAYFHTHHVHDYVDNILDIPKSFPLDPSYRVPKIPSINLFTDLTEQLMRNYFVFTQQNSRVATTVSQAESWIQELDQTKTREQAHEMFLRLPQNIRDEIYKNLVETVVTQPDPTKIAPLYRHMYDESIRTMDLSIIKIFDYIKKNGLDDQTIVIVTSDHGQLLGEHGVIGHINGISQDEVHVPLFIRIPGVPARITDALTQNIDLFPTILDLVGIGIPKELAGISLVGELLGRPNATKNTFVLSHTTLPFLMYSIQTNRWRLIEAQYPQGLYHALYDLPRDPGELNSVASWEEPTVSRLTALIHETLRRQPVYPPLSPSFPEWINEKDRDKRTNN